MQKKYIQNIKLCLNDLYLFKSGNKPKFIEPIFSEANSGLNLSVGRTLSSTFMKGLPPVVILRIASVFFEIFGKNFEKASGD